MSNPGQWTIRWTHSALSARVIYCGHHVSTARAASAKTTSQLKTSRTSSFLCMLPALSAFRVYYGWLDDLAGHTQEFHATCAHLVLWLRKLPAFFAELASALGSHANSYGKWIRERTMAARALGSLHINLCCNGLPQAVSAALSISRKVSRIS